MKSLVQSLSVFTVKKFTIMVSGAILTLLLASYTVEIKINDEFLKQLGISKVDANNKISHSFLEGYIDAYGAKNIKSIALGNRTSITNNLLAYTKQYVSNPGFIKEYKALREQHKPEMPLVQTPEEFQRGIIEQAKMSAADLEKKIKTSDAQMKAVFEKTLESVRKQIQQAEDPNNRSIAGYRSGYPMLVKNRDESYAKAIAAWEAKYPAEHVQFIKLRLQNFLEETKEIDFGAQLTEKKGIKYFVNPAYERKSNYWKMAFRAGKEVVEPARSFVKEWVNSIP
jgi:soluble cytochrome b562